MNHLLHARIERGHLNLWFECVGTPSEHYVLWERGCSCSCVACAADDHHGCSMTKHDHSFDGRAACETEFDASTCWVTVQDCPIEETFTGEWPERVEWPVPVDVQWMGDGDWITTYAGTVSP